MEKKKIEIYTDGSCIGNPGPGGWAAIIFLSERAGAHKREVVLSGGEADTTNNRMEMTALINALKWLNDEKNQKSFIDASIEVFSDSNLLVQTLNLGWKRKANTDLWAEIDKLRAFLPIKYTWVKAHAKNERNNKVDALAFNEAKKF